MSFIRKYGLTLAGGSIGLLGGYLYWRYIGCASGACPITSSPANSTLYGAVMGGLLFNLFQKKKSVKE